MENKIDDLRKNLEHAAITEQEVTRDQIKQWLVRDIRAVHILLAEMLNTKEITEAITEVFWQRFLRLKKEDQIKESLEEIKNVQ